MNGTFCCELHIFVVCVCERMCITFPTVDPIGAACTQGSLLHQYHFLLRSPPSLVLSEARSRVFVTFLSPGSIEKQVSFGLRVQAAHFLQLKRPESTTGIYVPPCASAIAVVHFFWLSRHIQKG